MINVFQRKDIDHQQKTKESHKTRLQKRAIKVQSDEIKIFIRAEEHYRRLISSDPVLAEIGRSFCLFLPEPLMHYVAGVMDLGSSKRTDRAAEIVKP